MYLGSLYCELQSFKVAVSSPQPSPKERWTASLLFFLVDKFHTIVFPTLEKIRGDLGAFFKAADLMTFAFMTFRSCVLLNCKQLANSLNLTLGVRKIYYY